ncbi:hypothetical protein GOP47_0018691 [Adiantum capillus-veneris]|uniref:DUF4408 domain-containing protein n=1 Tax=Adiantum capillus-veneris TaxID=13818 RepID=A0A9D4Z9V8_ADICA|nr:hypothetical protein GOP47_0018691 [Adiantum capillus-veneris]
MTEWFLRSVVHAIWGRRKDVYYALSFISIAGNLVVLVGPTVQTSILSYIHVLQTIGLLQKAASAIGSLQTVLHAISPIGALQTHAWIAVPHLAELVLQRSVLYILLNLIVARIIHKSGLFAKRSTTSHPAFMKQDESRAVRNLQVVYGSHWLAPSYLHTVYSTMSNYADVPSGPSMRDCLFHCIGSFPITDLSNPLLHVQGHLNGHYSHNDSLSQNARPMPATPAAPSPTPPSPPSLFTIEPLDELVKSMQTHQTPFREAQISRHPLRKVATKVDLVQAVRARRRKESTPIIDDKPTTNQQKSGRSMKGVKEKHGITSGKEYNKVHSQSMKQGKVAGGGGGVELVWGREDDDNELSRQEFNERVDTFICKFKRSLTMQRKNSVNRLLGIY